MALSKDDILNANIKVDLHRKLKARAAGIPACVLDASQCKVSEAMALTQQVQALRDRLMA